MNLWVHASNSLQPYELAHQTPLSMGFSRQEYWSGLPWPSPGGSSHVSYVSCISKQVLYHRDFPGGLEGKASVCLQCRRPGFDPQVGKISWRRKWQPTPVLLPVKCHRWRSLLGYSPWDRKELHTSEQLHFFITSAIWDTLMNLHGSNSY